MAWTTADVELLEGKIRLAIEDGTWRATSIQFSDQSVALLSLKDAMDLLGQIKGIVTSATTTGRYMSIGKGV